MIIPAGPPSIPIASSSSVPRPRPLPSVRCTMESRWAQGASAAARPVQRPPWRSMMISTRSTVPHSPPPPRPLPAPAVSAVAVLIFHFEGALRVAVGMRAALTGYHYSFIGLVYPSANIQLPRKKARNHEEPSKPSYCTTITGVGLGLHCSTQRPGPLPSLWYNTFKKEEEIFFLF